uniref:uncharacterized protein lcorl isoform X2 n=1 Tax=Doryrhamphus excisus TaxID=161450 RepID=UPI0025ADDFF2|nr:uncharacterized protein lcorl isoform X2 [Doryrhamphus excisus]
MAAVPCSKCTVERKGFRRELDSWRYKLIHCVGFESIIEGICGSMLTRDLKLCDDCEPKEVDDWSPEANCSHCSFCNLPLDKLGDQAPATASSLSSPSDYSPCQASTISESSQTAHRFLQAVFHKKDMSLGCDSNIPQIAQELMKKMIHQFAMEYASKCLLHTTPVDVATRTSSPFFETADAPLDLTVSRSLGEKERESNTDGVLDLSKNNGASSTTSTSSTLNAKASGSLLPSDEEASEDTQQRKSHQESALAIILSSLCPAHRSLLYQMLKLAHKERLLSSPDRVPTESHCCHGGVKSNSMHLLPDCGHRGCRSTMCHPRHAIPNHGIAKFPLKDNRSVASSGPHNCRMQRCRMDTYTVVCHKSQHCISCQGLHVDPINIVCSFDPCTPICCKHHNPHPCICLANHTCLTHLKNTSDTERDGDPPCPVLNREQNHFPPPLSPVPLDIEAIPDEMPPSLCHHTLEEEALITDKAIPEEIECRKNQSGTLLQDVFNRFSEKLETIRPAEKDVALVYPAMHVTEKDAFKSSSIGQNSQDAHLTEIITTVLHASSTSDYSLSDLVNRHDSQEPRSPNTRLRRRQEVQAAMATPADGTMTRRKRLQIKRELAVYESRTYNRRNVAQARRSQIKDGNVAVNAASTLSTSNVIQEETEPELNMEDQRVKEVPLDAVSAKRHFNDIRIQTAEISADENEPTSPDLQSNQDDGEQSQVITPCDDNVSEAMILENDSCTQGVATKNCDDRPDCSHNPTEDSPGQRSPPKESRRSRRNIVPPQRFSSYVTEPRKMYFVACFSESIFSQRIHNDRVFTLTTSDALMKNVHVKDASLEPSEKDSNLSSCDLPEALQNISREEHGPCYAESNEQSQSESKPVSRRLQYPNVGVTTRSATCAKTSFNCPIQYTSPIKLMFVSPLKDKQGIKYRLKSARSGSNAQAEEPFDPCKESSWAGTTEKNQNTSQQQSSTSPGKTACPITKSGSPQAKSTSSSLKSTSPLKSGLGAARTPSSSPKSPSSPNVPLSSLCRSTSSPSKSASAPLKSNSKSPSPCGKPTASPRLASSPPKLGSRRVGECTPPESQRSPSDLQAFHGTTSPKRRPGRPKKLGPHLEQKAKRPIGRPRKQKPEDTEPGAKAAKLPDVNEDNVNKNLKITVLYGRSRRNKRMVSESFDKLQTEFQDAWRAANLKNRLGVLTRKSEINNSQIGSADVRPMKDLSSDLKSQKRDKALPSRKPGRPAKVKISGISVTVTTVSPKQRKILIERSPDRQMNKTLLPEFQSVKEPRTISKNCKQAEEPKESQSVNWNKPPNQPVAVRQSKRVSKPSICFLHAVATSTTRTYSHSNALLRRSKKLLLNKASHKRKQEEKQSRVERSGMKRQHCDRQKKNISKELTRVAGVSVDSIFAPKQAFRWWPASAEEQALKQELARRIRLISETWVSDIVENHQVDIKVKVDTEESKSSVVQSLFSCPPNRPRSCSMPQLCSWFMQTTETQSLAIVKKTSSRNPYEVMHFPCSFNKEGVQRQSPQAERLRRHLKKFAKTLPKSPVQLKQAERRLKRMRAPLSIRNIKRRLFITRMVSPGRWSQYQATLLRARTRFLTPKQRKRWAEKQISLQEPSCRLKLKASNKTSAKEVQSQQEPNISNIWNAQPLKECRVFLRKLNKSAEDWDSGPLTLDDKKSASAYRNEDLQGVQAVKRRKTSTNGGSAESVPESSTWRHKEGTCSHDVSTGAPQPPPAKRLRQSRLKGLSGPRWCDFVFGS